MKKNVILFLITVFTLSLHSCLEPEDTMDLSLPSFEDFEVTVGVDMAFIDAGKYGSNYKFVYKANNTAPSDAKTFFAECEPVECEEFDNHCYYIFSGLEPSTTYYYAQYLEDGVGRLYSDIKSFTTISELIFCPNGKHPHTIDMGNGLKWACCNVGAQNPVEYGDYLAWGETKTKDTYGWSTYSLCKGSNTTMTKYCNSSSCGTVDNIIKLELSDDAARANWGGTWRMPTIDEFSTLITNCTWTWTLINGVYGYTVTASNGNMLFFPAAGCRQEWGPSYAGSLGLYWAGSRGFYWSSSLNTSDSSDACGLFFVNSEHYTHIDSRSFGLSVRPVTE